MQIQKLNRMTTFRLIIAFALLFTCCKKDETFFEESQIQIDHKTIDHTIYYGHEGTFDTIRVPISVIGKKIDSDQTIKVSSTTNDTLIQNGAITFYESITLSTLAENNHLIVIVNLNEISSQESYSFKLKISGDYVAKNYDEVEITLYKQALIDVFYGNFLCFEKEYNHSYTVNILHTIPVSDTLLIENFWNFSQIGSTVMLILNYPKNGDVIIPEQNFIDLEGNNNTVTATGNYNDNGQITVDYKIEGINNFIEENTQLYSSFNE